MNELSPLDSLVAGGVSRSAGSGSVFESLADPAPDHASTAPKDGPHLTLVRPEDEDAFDIAPPSSDVPREVAGSSDAKSKPDSWPWLEWSGSERACTVGSEQDRRQDDLFGTPPSLAESLQSLKDDQWLDDPAFLGGDHSQAEDVILCTPLEETISNSVSRQESEVEEADVIEPEIIAPNDGIVVADSIEDSANATTISTSQSALATGRRAVLPKSIGAGRLLPSKLTWRPGDPFGGVGAPSPTRFRWEVMLTSACITAAGGLGCIWLLRTFFT